MSAKQSILKRIDDALESGRANSYITDSPSPSPPDFNEDLVRQIPAGPSVNILNSFVEQIEKLGDSAKYFTSVAECREWVVSDVKRRDLTDGTIDPDAKEYLGFGEDEEGINLNSVTEKTEISKAKFSVTLAVFGIVEMGTVALSSSSLSYRMNSLAPPLHYCILKKSLIVPDLVDAIQMQQNMQNPAGIVWITGSSRTADIDGILIHGAHGPKELTILIIED